MGLVFFYILWYNRSMSMGNVKHSIQIEEIKDDIFSDDIKTSALIEEIEAAEVAARQANIEKQIENSQPSWFEKASEKIKHEISGKKEAFNNKIADLKTEKPKDPRVKKVSLGKKVTSLGLVVNNLRPAKAKKGKISLAGRANALVPGGISKKTVVELSVTGALIVAGAEVWVWNLAHPVVTPTDNSPAIEVPVTGDVSTDGDSPFAENVEVNSDASQEDEKPATEETGTNTYTTRSVNYRQSVSGTTDTNTTNEKKPADSTAGKKPAAAVQPEGAAVDGSWDDSYDSNWPTNYEAVDENETGDGNDDGSSDGEDAEQQENEEG